ncbi:NIC96 [[Candida] subhashii]|uniref:Nuclear pore protein n=1 Tax=[Candida] subhashii TaxID=561895 RepID=A0A8J5QKE9_9ASCO|nr:NIC96 [[Candida] subhashii]KAG7663763.1 NIC96 [[Candida] subhashii]
MSLFGTQSKTIGTSGGFSFGQNQPTSQFSGTTPSFGGSTTTGGTTAPAAAGSTLNPSANAASSTFTLPTSINATNSSKLLKELLESANNLPKNTDNVELGSIHLTLNELQRKSQQLRKLDDSKKDVSYTKAHYLLAGSGISAEEIENDLNAIHIPQRTTTTGGVGPVTASRVGVTSENIENYLNTKKDESILNSIEQSLALASKDFDNFINANISIDWKVRRDELRKAVGLKYNGDNSADSIRNSLIWKKTNFSSGGNILSPLSTSTTASSSAKQMTREKFENHAKIVYALNEARLESRNFPLCLNFNELNKLQNDMKSKQISEIWKILIELTNEKFSKTSQEQKFYNVDKDELDSIIVNNSKNYLQQEFFNYVDELYIKDNNKTPNFLPATNLNKISYFIHQIILKNDPDLVNKTLLVNGTPIWALIFYLIRAGLYLDAVGLVLGNREIFNKFDKNFPVYIKKYVDSDNHTLPSDLSERLHQEFNQQFQFIINDVDTSINYDPYKYSVYKIIGKCDLTKKSLPQSINLSIEDWLWFHLSIIKQKQSNNESTLLFENYDLSDLQNKIIHLGPKAFLTSPNNPLYLKTLILVGLYELAVQYTYEQLNECDAVHLAIGFIYYGLLKCSNASKDVLLSVFDNEYQINFSRLVGSFTRSFKISDPKVACQYLILIAMAKGGECKEEIAICHEALRELILTSREFGILLGELNQANGTKISGILERQRKLIKLENIDEFYHQIIEITASKCEEEGRIFDALLLYQLCCEYDTVVSLINKLLAEIFATSDLNKPIIRYGNYQVISNGYIDDNKECEDTVDNNIILLSQHIMRIFNNNGSILDKISSQKKRTCDLLLPMVTIRDLFLKKNWREVITQINQLNLIPVGPNDDLIKIRNMSEMIQNNDLDDNLIKVIPSLLIMVMTSVCHLNYEILSKRYQSLSNQRDELSSWKQVAKNCMIYAGMVQYKMPRETYSLLINLESQL